MEDFKILHEGIETLQLWETEWKQRIQEITFDFWRFHVYNGAENKNFTSIKKFWILIFFEKHSWYAVSMDVLSVNDYFNLCGFLYIISHQNQKRNKQKKTCEGLNDIFLLCEAFIIFFLNIYIEIKKIL